MLYFVKNKAMRKIKRNFSGETYRLTAAANMVSKQFAIKHAKNLRKKGYKARVVRGTYGYDVYFKKK